MEASDAKWLHLQRFLSEVSFDQESRMSLSNYDSDSSGSSDCLPRRNRDDDSRHIWTHDPSPDLGQNPRSTRTSPALQAGSPRGHGPPRHAGRTHGPACIGPTPHSVTSQSAIHTGIHRADTKPKWYQQTSHQVLQRKVQINENINIDAHASAYQANKHNHEYQQHRQNTEGDQQLCDPLVRSSNKFTFPNHEHNSQTLQQHGVTATDNTPHSETPFQNTTKDRVDRQPVNGDHRQYGDNLQEELAIETDLFTKATNRQTHGHSSYVNHVTWVRTSPTLELHMEEEDEGRDAAVVDTDDTDDSYSDGFSFTADPRPYTTGTMSSYEELDDLTHLVGPLTENSIVTCLQARIAAHALQTRIGRVLLCINDLQHPPPSRALTAPTSPGDRLAGVVREAIDHHRETGRSQAIIISGASGSGKTHCAQLLLQHVFGVGGGGPETDAFKHVQASLTVLQSLGTAATITNPHSSRLGYFFENSVSDSAVYCTKIHCYFVDRERLVRPTATERNFHIFYDMLASLGREEKTKLHLAGRTNHSLRYLGGGPLGNVGDRQRFEAWKASLSVLGIPLSDMMRVLSAILLLGNVKFVGTVGPELDVVGNNELKAVAALLGVSGMTFYRGFTTKTCRIRGQICKSIPDANMANRTRDCLAMGLYCRTILAVVRRANSLRRLSSTLSSDSIDSANETGSCPEFSRQYSMSTSSQSLCGSSHPTDFIGVLDMFGFQVSETNRLEELCTNLCAEVMQHFYTSHVFRRAQHTLRGEGVQFEEVPYFDNAPILELLSSQRFGIFTVIETSSVSSIKESLVSQLKSRHRVNDYFFEPHPKDDASFGVRHFAGRVVYDSSAFMSVNVDTLCEDIVSVFSKQTCNFGFVSHLFAKELKSRTGVTGGGSGASYRIMPYSLTHNYSGHDKEPGSLCADFQMKMDKLLKILRHTNPHFIRCMKTNDTCEPGLIDKEVLLRQLRSLQVLETVQIMAGGIAHKLRFSAFRQRYKLFLKASDSTANTTALEACKLILDEFLSAMDTSHLPYVSTQWSLGRRYIFYSEGTRQQLEAVRAERLHVSAAAIQAAWRGLTCRRGWHTRRQRLVTDRQQRIMQAIHYIRDQRETPVESASTPTHQNDDLLQRVAELYSLNLDRPPAVPASRQYSILGGEVKVTFPQTRRLRDDITETSTPGGLSRMDKGAIVKVLGPSSRRGHVMVQGETTAVHVPWTFMDCTYVPPYHCSQRPLTV